MKVWKDQKYFFK